MNEDEEKALQYLKSLGYTDSEVKHEPDGKVPPDFLINGVIAVEVRRFNRNYVRTSGKKDGFEDLILRIEKGMEELLKCIGPIPPQQSWFVSLKVRRPLQWGKIKDQIEHSLKEFLREPKPLPHVMQLKPNLKMVIKPSEKLFTSTFCLTPVVDLDVGAYVVSETHRNLEIVIAEKTDKVLKNGKDYPEWWLVLVDHTGFRLDDEELKDLASLPRVQHDWRKIVIIDRNDPEDSYVFA